MSIFDLYMKSRISAKLLEEELYAEALRELEHGIRRDGLWAKAFSKSSGNEEKAKAFYIEFRVQALRDELALYKTLIKEEQEKVENPNTKKYIKKNEKDRSSQEEMRARKERIKVSLREKLGREPTEDEIDRAKWDGICL
ncbi:MAG: hypothetical protein AXA67_12030 [Methylothermaceae bacteria B42]|nr:MAG: hypothetical protein AXA67_12030 [Methylothermaceae bacteria B42]HHJ39259.1 hypothetical protein [Methylothermaceae bacterium]